MIRFIDLTGQITLNKEDKYFAWFDTITDTFLEFNGTQIFHNWSDFEEWFKDFLLSDEKHKRHSFDDLKRFKSLFLWK